MRKAMKWIGVVLGILLGLILIVAIALYYERQYSNE
jgi:uncharacterized protein YpmB